LLVVTLYMYFMHAQRRWRMINLCIFKQKGTNLPRLFTYTNDKELPGGGLQHGNTSRNCVCSHFIIALAKAGL